MVVVRIVKVQKNVKFTKTEKNVKLHLNNFNRLFTRK